LRITADTNILVRAAVADDPDQAMQAMDLLRDAEIVVLTLPALCEFVWVLTRAYRREAKDIAAAIRRLDTGATVRVDRVAVEAGLAALEAGGDFADGVIAFEGRRLGGAIFASFDRKAVESIAASGGDTHFLGSPAN
jgi:predicted nucleic-acid-binding protein